MSDFAVPCETISSACAASSGRHCDLCAGAVLSGADTCGELDADETISHRAVVALFTISTCIEAPEATKAGATLPAQGEGCSS